jgi:DUF4097 and DUF4098 domain-containing protein YvlB
MGVRMYVSARPLARVVAVALVATGLAACDLAVDGHGGFDFGMASAKAADQWARNYEVPSGGRLEIINVNGKITAEATDGARIEISAERTAKASSEEAAKELLGKIEMREEVGEGRVRIEVRAPRFNGGGGHEIQWTVKVPRGVGVDLRTINGGVKMTGLEGDVRARSTNGGITGVRLAATSLDAAVTNGGIEIELTKAVATGSFEIEAVNGGVSLMMPSDSKADVSGRCVNGGITVLELPLEIVGEQSKRRLEGKLNGGGARISLETVNGGVKIGRFVSTT